MLTEAQTEIIKSTVPILEQGGETLTTHFYKKLLAENPEVRPFFNQAHQAGGTQPRALAGAVLAYARNIDKLENLGPVASKIVNKHVALQVQPEQYPIVGACLLQSIRDVLGPEVATDAVIDAWGAAYGQLADILIGAEKEVYDSIAAAPGGWRGGRKFKVVKIVAESSVIKSLYLSPVDCSKVLINKPGQFIGLHVVIDGVETRRNYSLSSSPDGLSYRISVKHESEGVVSSYLHSLSEGAELELFPPAGDFTLLADTDRIPVFISGGVGITPTLPMLEQALSTDRHAVFVNYAHSAEQQAFGEWLEEQGKKHQQLKLHCLVHERPTAAQLKQWLPAADKIEAYFLGPKPFMVTVKHALLELGVPAEHMHYEFFGPAEELA